MNRSLVVLSCRGTCPAWFYRLAGYWVPFLIPGTNRFQSGASFDDVLALYEFDKRLRFIILDALERIEIACRVAVAHLLGQIDLFSPENIALLDQRFVREGYSKWIQRYRDSIDRTTYWFILDFRRQYGLPLPVWLGVELWDFGKLSMFYSGMRFKDRDTLAAGYGLGDGRIMKSWLHNVNHFASRFSLTVTRNICAHHGRFWNRTLARPVALPDGSMAPALLHLHTLSSTDSRRQYVVLSCIVYLLERIDPQSGWKAQLLEHLEEIPRATNVGLSEMGFPQDWRTLTLWSC